MPLSRREGPYSVVLHREYVITAEMIDDQASMACIGMFGNIGKRLAYNVISLYLMLQWQIEVGDANGAIEHDVVPLAKFIGQGLQCMQQPRRIHFAAEIGDQ